MRRSILYKVLIVIGIIALIYAFPLSIFGPPALTAILLVIVVASLGGLNGFGVQGVFFHADLRKAFTNGLACGLLYFTVMFVKGLHYSEWMLEDIPGGTYSQDQVWNLLIAEMGFPLLAWLILYFIPCILSATNPKSLYRGKLAMPCLAFWGGACTCAGLMYLLFASFSYWRIPESLTRWGSRFDWNMESPAFLAGLLEYFHTNFGRVSLDEFVKFEAFHYVSGAYVLALAAGYVVLIAFHQKQPGSRDSRFTGVPALCILLMILTLVTGFLDYYLKPELQIVLLGLVLALVYLSNRNRGHAFHRFAGFAPQEDQYAIAPGLRHASSKAIVSAPLTDRPHLIKPGDFLKARVGESKESRVIIVAVSGGGIRAAVWTAHVLRQLRDLPGFHDQLCLVTGASGGMLGAAQHLMAAYLPGGQLAGPIRQGRGDAYLKDLADDSLSAVMWGLVLNDVPSSLFGGRWPDRGEALERRWAELSRKTVSELPQGVLPLDSTFGRLDTLVRAGKMPALIFSPMCVEDGRQMLISNLELSSLCQSGPGPRDFDFDKTRPAFQFFDLFPESIETFKLVTAARMSASFPYVTPAGELPTRERTRIVDAGYYDNFGIQTAAHFLRKHGAEIKGRVALVEIRDGVSSHDRICGREPKAPIFPGLTTPLDAVLSARNSGMAFQNDQLLSSLPIVRDQEKFQHFVFELEENVASLSLYLHQGEIENITQAAADIHSALLEVADERKPTICQTDAANIEVEEKPRSGIYNNAMNLKRWLDS